MDKNAFVKRIFTLIAGLFILAFGVALSVKANMGISPVSCVPFIYSSKFPLSMGLFTIILNVLLILLQIAILRKNFKLVQLLQLPAVLVFGFFTDYTLSLVSNIHFDNYWIRLALCLISCLVVALGIFLEVKANLVYLAVEGLSLALVQTFKLEFGKAKITIDYSLVTFGIISSFIFMGNLTGVREGTIIAAFLVGFTVRFYSKKIHLLDAWLQTSPTHTEEQKLSASKNLVITISREYGSGGYEIGRKLAQELGFKFYDKELVQLTAEQSGFTPQYIQEHEQKLASSLLHSLYEQNYEYINEQKPPLDALFMVQSKIIRDISEKENCVIVGRCANFILKNNPNSFNIFIHADNQFRLNRIMEENKIDRETAEKEMEKTDKGRANHCKYYTGKSWNDISNYHFTTDSSVYGIENSVNLIKQAFEIFKNNKTELKS
jgi:uncharacterized membrane protein YczE/cytidylate kinase